MLCLKGCDVNFLLGKGGVFLTYKNELFILNLSLGECSASLSIFDNSMNIRCISRVGSRWFPFKLQGQLCALFENDRLVFGDDEYIDTPHDLIGHRNVYDGLMIINKLNENFNMNTFIYKYGEEFVDLGCRFDVEDYFKERLIGIKKGDGILAILDGEVNWEIKKSEGFLFSHVRSGNKSNSTSLLFLHEANKFNAYQKETGRQVYSLSLASPVVSCIYKKFNYVLCLEDLYKLSDDGQVIKHEKITGLQSTSEALDLALVDAQYVYLKEQGHGVHIYDLDLNFVKTIRMPEDYNFSVQYHDDTINIAMIATNKTWRYFDSSYVVSWVPEDVVKCDDLLLPVEKEYLIEKCEAQVDGQDVSYYQVTIDTASRDDLFRITDVIIPGVAERYGKDAGENEFRDKSWNGLIQVLISPELLTELSRSGSALPQRPDGTQIPEMSFLEQIDQRLCNKIQKEMGAMSGGAVSGDGERHVFLEFLANNVALNLKEKMAEQDAKLIQDTDDRLKKEVDDILVECNTQEEFEAHLKFIESDMDPNEYDDQNQYESALNYHQKKYNLLLVEGGKKGFKV